MIFFAVDCAFFAFFFFRFFLNLRTARSPLATLRTSGDGPRAGPVFFFACRRVFTGPGRAGGPPARPFCRQPPSLLSCRREHVRAVSRHDLGNVDFFFRERAKQQHRFAKKKRSQNQKKNRDAEITRKKRRGEQTKKKT